MNIQLEKIILIFVRITTFVFMTPGFSFQGMPNIFKFVLSAGFTLLAYTVVPDITPVTSSYFFIFFIFKEVLFGAALGFISKLIFGIIEIAGHLVDFQAGFSMATIYDPTVGGQISSFGRVYHWMSLMIFFIMDLHHKVIEVLIKSFDYVPLTEISMKSSKSVPFILDLFSKTFELAFKLAIPMIMVALITDIILGIISRTIPQINVLMLGMPLKALIAFVLTFFILFWLLEAIGKDLSLLPYNMERFIRLLQ